MYRAVGFTRLGIGGVLIIAGNMCFDINAVWWMLFLIGTAYSFIGIFEVKAHVD